MVDDMPFLLIFIILYAVFATIRLYYRSRPSVRECSERRLNRWIDRIGGLAGVAVSISVLGYWASIALYVISPPWMLWSHLSLPLWIRWMGVLIGIVCLPILVWVHHTMGRYYFDRLELRENHELIISGPFSRIRNPMYLVLLTFSAAMGLVTSYFLNLFFSFLTMASMNWLVGKEEEMMLKRFGDEYRAYVKRTGRFLPRLRWRHTSRNSH